MLEMKWINCVIFNLKIETHGLNLGRQISGHRQCSREIPTTRVAQNNLEKYQFHLFIAFQLRKLNLE